MRDRTKGYIVFMVITWLVFLLLPALPYLLVSTGRLWRGSNSDLLYSLLLGWSSRSTWKWLAGKNGKECTSHTRAVSYLADFSPRLYLRRLWILDNSSSSGTQWSPVPLWLVPLCPVGYLDTSGYTHTYQDSKELMSTWPLLPSLKPLNTTHKAQ